RCGLLPWFFKGPSLGASLGPGTYPHFWSRWGMARRFLRSLIHTAKSPSAVLWMPRRVVASGSPIWSSVSASSASSVARLASTMSQNAAVLGGGAFGSKQEISSFERYAATWRSPPWSYQPQSLDQ